MTTETRAPGPQAPDTQETAKQAEARRRAVRPRDAATLILVRNSATGSAKETEVLMGRRHPNHRFMPNQWVFPGGRVDRSDGLVRPPTPLRPEVLERLAKACSIYRANALALAAIRETFEETGLAVGRPFEGALKRPKDPAWSAFYETGVAPAPDVLDYVARAITPPVRPMRFHARFFMADAEHARGTLQGSGELEGLYWVPLQEAKGLDVPRITAVILDDLEDLVEKRGAERPVPVHIFRHGKPVLVFD
ncbi:NUDIX hydrolase [Zavarzinia sp. CC-PAN008]|uniref:NUDIX hydrolase n=1 Tax=Zavarzinia sp. CC-PAN008 TaxID=3243332 RepID=UPI003F7439E0